MNYLYITLINLIIVFIAYVVLNNKINKNSTSTLLEKYARDVENLIIELNRAVEEVLNLSEERTEELKKVIKRAERLLKKPEIRELLANGKNTEPIPAESKEEGKGRADENVNLLEKTRRLLSMGHTKEEIAEILNMKRAEVDFLQSLHKK
jgi:NAD-specific glutamate dehydrogenase